MMEYQTFVSVFVLAQLAVSAGTSCPTTCQSCDKERVICRAASLTSTPTQLSEDTLVIDLTQNNIKTLDGLPSLPQVQSMRLLQNELTVIPGGAFKTAPMIMSLDLSMNKITKVYAKGLKGLDHLKSISLTGNKLSTIGTIFKQCKSLTSVRLGNNEITSIEEDNFKHNSMIKMLDLSHNKIVNIHPDAFKSLDMLRYVILSNNPLTTLQDLTFTSSILSLMDFTGCMLTSVPKTMPPSLNDFRLGNNKIKKILHDDFQNITNLKILFLNDNEISDVEHRSFSGLDNLKELWLSRNQLVYVPRGLPANLEKLHLDNNRVVELEPMLFKNGSKLMKLSLESNNVRKVHQDSLKEVKNLDELNLQGNQISLIDVGTFSKVPNLKVLKLSYNPVQVFENGAFQNLGSLSEIYLSHIEHKVTGRDRLLGENFLNVMPNLTKIDLTSTVHLTNKLFELFEQDSAPVMETVKTVILQYNELNTVPENLKQVFPNVESLILDGNPFTCDKKLKWLKEWMESSSVNFHQNEELTCNQPTSLKGRILGELRADELVEEAKEVQQQEVQPQDVTETKEHQSHSQPDPVPASQPSGESHLSRQEAPTYQPSQPSQSRPYGVRVIIKPPAGSSKAPSKHHKTNKLSKADRAARKAARQAERERKKRLKAERKKTKKRHHGKGKKRRKKRKIRNKYRDGKRCKVDENGVMQCTKRKKCKVDDLGNVVCKKRRSKKKNKTVDAAEN